MPVYKSPVFPVTQSVGHLSLEGKYTLLIWNTF